MVECSYQEGLGESAKWPCFTSFEKLRVAPQTFHGRWIAVRGFYVGGFETSSLSGVLADGKLNIPASHQWAGGAHERVFWQARIGNVGCGYGTTKSGRQGAALSRLRISSRISQS
jgi:hypothetical protein